MSNHSLNKIWTLTKLKIILTNLFVFRKFFFFSNIITMGGGLMQLVAYGAQDVYLTGNPQITFWKVTYRRHTNFAMESIEQTFNGQADFGRRVTCTISRNGDLAYRTYLQVTLPEINQTDASYARWLDFPGEQMISQVEVEIGGQRIDRQYGDWMHIWNQLTLSKEQERGYYKMVGNTTQLTYITDPNFEEVDGPCATGTDSRATCAPRATPFRRRPSTCRSSSGTAATRVLLFRSLPFSTTRSRSTLIFARSTSASGLLLRCPVVPRPTLLTMSRLLPRRSTSTTCSLTPTSAAVWPRTRTST